MSLTQTLAGPNGDLLGLARFQGGGVTAERSLRDRSIEAAIAMASAEGLEAMLRRKRQEGWRSMVVLGEPRLFDALRRAGSGDLPAPIPIIPNLQGFMREAVEHGMMGAGVRRALRVGPAGLATLGLRSVGRLPALWRRDFPTMLQSFVELELAEWVPFRPPLVLLGAPMTDMSVAMDNPRIVNAFIQSARRRARGAAVGLVSFNFGRLVPALARWGLAVDALIVPWDATGYGHRPDEAACRQAARLFEGPIWGLRRQEQDAPDAVATRDLADAGLAGWVREDAQAWRPGPTAKKGAVPCASS
jgi:hypothetical protein